MRRVLYNLDHVGCGGRDSATVLVVEVDEVCLVSGGHRLGGGEGHEATQSHHEGDRQKPVHAA